MWKYSFPFYFLKKILGSISCRSVKVWCNSAANPIVPGLFSLRRIFIFTSNSFVIGLFRLFFSSCFNISGFYKSRISSISFRFSNLMEYKFLKYSLMISCNFFGVCCNLLLFILILLIWVLSSFWLAGPRICQSCLSSQNKTKENNPFSKLLLDFLILCTVFFVCFDLTYFFSEFYYSLPSIGFGFDSILLVKSLELHH